jgi:hypothetical protein
MMDRTVIRKASLRDADDALCTGQTSDELLAVLAELNRIGLVALGLEDQPLRRSSARKFTFREFSEAGLASVHS